MNVLCDEVWQSVTAVRWFCHVSEYLFLWWESWNIYVSRSRDIFHVRCLARVQSFRKVWYMNFFSDVLPISVSHVRLRYDMNVQISYSIYIRQRTHNEALSSWVKSLQRKDVNGEQSRFQILCKEQLDLQLIRSRSSSNKMMKLSQLIIFLSTIYRQTDSEDTFYFSLAWQHLTDVCVQVIVAMVRFSGSSGHSGHAGTTCCFCWCRCCSCSWWVFHFVSCVMCHVSCAGATPTPIESAIISMLSCCKINPYYWLR